MVEDTSGNQTMKCLGTYKPPPPAPIIINKQVCTYNITAQDTHSMKLVIPKFNSCFIQHHNITKGQKNNLCTV